MVQQQDSSDPTGVALVSGGRTTKALARARDRKAAAALEMSLQGFTWEDIAISLGYPTARQALVAVEKTLETRLDAEDKTLLRNHAKARMDSLLRAVWSKAHDQDNPDQLAAHAAARATINDQVKLLGLAAPVEVTIYNPHMDEITAWVAQARKDELATVTEADIVEAELVDDDALPA